MAGSIGGKPKPSRVYTSGATEDFVAHKGVIETVEMNIWHLKLVLERLAKPSRCPRFEWCLVPLGVLVTVGYGFITTDFHDTFGVPKATWQALSLGTLGISAFLTTVLFLWWLGDQVKHLRWPRKTTDQLVDEIVAQMAAEKKQLADEQAAAATQAAR